MRVKRNCYIKIFVYITKFYNICTYLYANFYIDILHDINVLRLKKRRKKSIKENFKRKVYFFMKD